MPIMRTALVNKKGMVEEIVISGPNWEPPKGMTLVPSETANHGDLWDGQVFTRPEPAITKDHLLFKARSHRRAIARSGVSVNIGLPGNDPIMVKVETDEMRVSELMVFVHMAEADPHFVATWVMDSGDILRLDARQIVEVRKAVFKHITHTHAVLGTMTKAIHTGHVASAREIYKPETATAIEMPPWMKK